MLYGKEKVDKEIEYGNIEIVPFAFMRGRTFVDAFVIVDEAQNVTHDQMETVLGRLGKNSKMVICGDLAQIDLKVKKETGFSFLTRIEEQVQGFRVFALKANHRHEIVSPNTLIESRFGQSIRFSAYNNPFRAFSPTLIIRNRESSLTQISSAASGSINEDINRDGSSIVLSSGEYILPFIPGTIDEKGSTDFQTKPQSFKPYPEKLKGDQMILSSGRLILSARNAEMMFYSKGNYGFVSDGQLSIDNRLGMNVSVNDNISFVTNNRDFQIFSGNGSVFLGSKDLEPLVKGQKLVDILKELIDAIGEMQFLTPSGPTAIGPKNKPEFGKISGKLNDILSKLNQTS
jgi:hypothetical protein